MKTKIGQVYRYVSFRDTMTVKIVSMLRGNIQYKILEQDLGYYFAYNIGEIIDYNF